MFPLFEIFNWFYIYTFWLTITICFFMFLFINKKLSHKFGINETFFLNRLFFYVFSSFLFARLFYILWNYNDFKFIQNPLEFFFMSDFNLSIIWWFFWFFIILFIQVILHGLKIWKYIDLSVISFLFIATIWYIWAFLWGQVYWKETNYWIEILYTNRFSPVPYEVPIFPLWIFYSIVFFILFCLLYILIIFIKTRWIIWYIWLIFIWITFLILENFSWKYDYLRLLLWINLTQIWWVIIIILWFYWLIRLFLKKDINKDNII